MINARHHRIHIVATTSRGTDTLHPTQSTQGVAMKQVKHGQRGIRTLDTLSRIHAFQASRISAFYAHLRSKYGVTSTRRAPCAPALYRIGGALRRSLTVSCAIGAPGYSTRLMRTALAGIARAGSVREWVDPLPCARERLTTSQQFDAWKVLA